MTNARRNPIYTRMRPVVVLINNLLKKVIALFDAVNIAHRESVLVLQCLEERLNMSVVVAFQRTTCIKCDTHRLEKLNRIVCHHSRTIV